MVSRTAPRFTITQSMRGRVGATQPPATWT